jgi:hypothetical protein
MTATSKQYDYVTSVGEVIPSECGMFSDGTAYDVSFPDDIEASTGSTHVMGSVWYELIELVLASPEARPVVHFADQEVVDARLQEGRYWEAMAEHIDDRCPWTGQLW